MTPSILITGLCLQGNKGGPALLLSIVKVLKERIPDLGIVVSVPRKELEEETVWSDYYNIQIIPELHLSALFGGPLCDDLERGYVKDYINVLRHVDGVLNMQGIAYVGPPIGTLRRALGGRFKIFVLTRLFGKPFFAWTQSYGPLSSLGIRLLARLDLGSLSCVLCRGEDCVDEVKKILPEQDIRSFPDVANVLSYDVGWGRDYLKHKFNLTGRFRITISPSSVIFNKSHGSASNPHVEQVVKIITDIASPDIDILLVPHTFRPKRSIPELCDFAVCRLIMEQLHGSKNVNLVDEDLCPGDLKSIIATASLHIGARYHSLVAALSSGVPAISLSWHPKYRDLMRQYGLERFVYNALEDPGTEAFMKLFRYAFENRESLEEKIACKKATIESEIQDNAQLVADIVETWR